MVNYYSLHWLKPSEWALAYPLVRMVHPQWTLAQWLKRARILSRIKGHAVHKAEMNGLLAVQDRRGMIHGLLLCRTEQNFTGTKYVRVSDLVLARLPGAQIDEAILEGIAQICTDQDCAGLMLDVPTYDETHLGLNKDMLKQYHFLPRGMIYSRVPP